MAHHKPAAPHHQAHTRHQNLRPVPRHHLGLDNMSTHAPNSRLYMLTPRMRPYVVEILERQGRDFTRCQQCGKDTAGHPELHHTRYDGATIYDLEIVCRSCNRLAVNRGLA
jgi:hypothetical protein